MTNLRTNSRKVILFIIPSLKVAGAEKVCCELADNLHLEEFHINIISLSDSIPLANLLANRNKINIYTCGSEISNFPWISIKKFFYVYKLIKKIEPQIVHSHIWGINSFYLFTFLFIKIKPVFISTIHSSEFIYTSNKLSSRLFFFIENLAYRVFKFHLIAISNTVKEMIIKKLYHKSLHLIYNGIDTTRFSPINKKKYTLFKKKRYNNYFPLLINVARAADEKRQIDIIRSIPFIKRIYPNVKLILIGRGNNEKFNHLTNQIGVYENVEFIETTNQVEKYLSIADIGIFPSLYEGFGLVVAEMMSSGLPVVISNVPSLKEITNNSQAAVIVPVRNHHAIANSVLYLLNNHDVKINITKNARKIVLRNYSLKSMIEKHTNLYRKVLNE